MSEDVERRLIKVLNNPTTSPFGNPIPGLLDLGVGPGLRRRRRESRPADRVAGRFARGGGGSAAHRHVQGEST